MRLSKVKRPLQNMLMIIFLKVFFFNIYLLTVYLAASGLGCGMWDLSQ